MDFVENIGLLDMAVAHRALLSDVKVGNAKQPAFLVALNIEIVLLAHILVPDVEWVCLLLLQANVPHS